MKKQLDFLVQYEVEFQGWQRRSSGKFTICYLFFLRKRRRWAFLNTLQALDPPTFKSFGLAFLRERLWASLICSKTARYRLFLAVVRCCVTTTLAAETFSLLSVYLNYKFGLGLPSFYLFFSFFKSKLDLSGDLRSSSLGSSSLLSCRTSITLKKDTQQRFEKT